MKTDRFYIFTIFITVAWLALVTPGQAEEAAVQFQSAEQYYERGEYGKAIEIYMDQLKGGAEDGALYYNIANCYLKKGNDIGKAIFFYKIAQRFIPNDSALLINLRYARSLMRQPDIPSNEPFLLNILLMAFDRLTLKETFTLWNIFYFGCAVFFVLSLFMKRMKGPLQFITILFFCLVLIMLVPIRAKIIHEENAGIVIIPVADARIEPFEDAASKFPLYNGMEVQVIKATKEWYKIKRPDGKIGWLPKESLWRISAPPF